MKNLKEARISAGLSQAELAEKIGVFAPYISNWETGKKEPSESQLESRRKVLDLGEDGASTDVSPVAAWLTKARSERGWSVPELAHKAGLTPPAVYRIESAGTRNLRGETRKKLETALGSRIPDETVNEVEAEANVQGLGPLEDFDPHDDDERPIEPGIYVFYDISERPIYVGEGKNVRRRIKNHEEKFWFRRPIVESASWIKIQNDILRSQIETLIIKFLKSNAVINKHNVER